MKSWKTTLGGALGAAGTALMGAGSLDWLPPSHKTVIMEVGFFAGILGVLFVGLFARDNDRTSEDVGAGQPPNPTPPRPGGALIISLCLAGLFGWGLFAGCQVSPTRAAYTAEATAQVSVETAMRAWNDYVGQFHPSLDQERQVKAAYERYRAAMVAMIDASELYASATSTNAPAAALSAELARQNAANRLTDLVNLLRQFGVKL
jgi:hypothetical protein